MRDNLLRAHLGIQTRVRIHSMLVFGEENGAFHLPYIMIERARAHKLRVGSYGMRRLGSEGGNLHRMLECAGCLFSQTP